MHYALLLLPILAVMLAKPSAKVELRPLRPITQLKVGECSVEVPFKLTIEDRGVEDYYCPRVEWEWEDGTRSTEEYDCPPFEEAKAEDHRKTWTRSPQAKRSGRYPVKVRLYRGDRLVRVVEASADVAGSSGIPEEMRARMGCR